MTKNGPGFGRAKNGIPFAPYLERPLTLLPCSLLRNRAEKLAVQVTSSQDQSQTESQKHVAQHKKGGKPLSPPPTPPPHPSKLKDQVGLNLKNAYDRNH